MSEEAIPKSKLVTTIKLRCRNCKNTRFEYSVEGDYLPCHHMIRCTKCNTSTLLYVTEVENANTITVDGKIIR